jgi:hypothetical protein
MSRKVTGADLLEVEVTLSGTYVPGVPEQGPTYACGGQPAEPEMVEDVEVTGLFGQRLVKAPPSAALSHDRVWEKVDLHYFATHIGCTGVECAAGTGLSAMAVSRHLAALRMEWREPERETT